MIIANNDSRQKFYDWLITQAERDDPVGDLATDVRRDSSFPINGDKKTQQSYLSGKGAHVAEAFDLAWQDFKRK